MDAKSDAPEIPLSNLSRWILSLQAFDGIKAPLTTSCLLVGLAKSARLVSIGAQEILWTVWIGGGFFQPCLALAAWLAIFFFSPFLSTSPRILSAAGL